MTVRLNILKIILYVFFIFFILNISFAKNLKISGLSKLSINDLQSLTSIDLNKSNLSEIEINDVITDFYKSDLIYDLKLTNDDKFFYIEIQENKFIENIYINGNIRIKDGFIIENLSIKKNSFIIKDSINNNINLIKNIYKSKGFNNVSVVASTEKFSEDRVNLIFNINEGDQIKIKRVKFVGNKSYSDRYLSSLIGTKSLSFYNIFSSGSNLNPDFFVFDKNKIKSFYKNKGFFNVKINYNISSISTNSYLLTFYIDEGDRIKINDIYFDLKNKDFEDLIIKNKTIFEKQLIKNNDFYDQQLIDEFISKLNSSLTETNNFNFAYRYKLENLDNIYSLKIYDVDVNVELINSINIYGNNITKDETIRSKLNFQPGDYYNENQIEISKKELLRYKYINNITISKETKNSKSNINIEIDENKKTGQILAAGTFSGDTGAGLQLGIKDNNIFGSGNNLDTNFLINEENTLFNIALIHYPLATSKINNRYSIFNTEKDLKNSFGFETEERGISYSLNFEYDENIDISSGISYKRSDRNSATKSITAVTDNIGNFDVYTIDFSISFDTTDDFLYPTDGIYNSLYLEYAPKFISDDNYYKFIIKSDLYQKFKNSNRFVFLSNDIGLSESLDNKLKTLNAFSLGGLNFKGFDYRGIGPSIDNVYLGGNKFFTSTIGIGGSFLFDDKDNISTKLFYSIGSIWDSDYTNQNDLDLRSSAGISFDILTAIGPISFSYAIPIEKNNDDKTREFNFTIGTSF